MILGANQPYFIPYIGYWQLINAVDVFAVSDDVNYIKRGWINRNKILSYDGFYGLDIKKASSNRLINELVLEDYSPKQKLRTIYYIYKRAPYFEEGYRLMEQILSIEERSLALFLTESIKLICRFLNIDTKIIKTSELQGSKDLRKEQKIYNLCQRLGANRYYNAIGGRELYSYKDFADHNIDLGFIKSRATSYKQFDNEFESNLSIIDVIMFNHKSEIKNMLGEFDIISQTYNTNTEHSL